MLELFMETIVASKGDMVDHDTTDRSSHSRASLFEPPSTELLDQSITLAELLGQSPTLLSALAAEWDRDSAELPGAMLTRLGAFVEANEPWHESSAPNPDRLLDFVYPVV